jgi:hypothetical protein
VKTKDILLPFEFKRWVKVLFIVWLAGHMAGIGGPNLNPAKNQKTPSRQPQSIVLPSSQLAPKSDPAIQTGTPTADNTPATAPSSVGSQETQKSSEPQKTLPIFLIVLAVFSVLLFAVSMMCLAARFNFILLDVVTSRNVSIREAFGRHKLLGNSYFLWSLVFGAVILFCLTLMALSIVFLAGIRFILVPLELIVLIPAVIILACVSVLIADFILPVMYQDQIKFFPAIKKFLASGIKTNSILKYLLIKMGLGILAFILLGIIGVVVGAISALLLLAILVPINFLASVKIFAAILAGISVTSIFVAAFLLIGFLSLPVSIFFRVFELTYLASLIPSYNLLHFSPETAVS